MTKSIWQRLKDNVRGVKGKFKRAYVPTTTPEEVALANSLKATLPADLATYIYVGGLWDVNLNRGIAGYVTLAVDEPAEQVATLTTGISSAYEAELQAMIAGLSAVELTKRQAGHFVLVTSLEDFVRNYNDFSLAAQYTDLPERATSTDRLYHDFVLLSATFRSLRVTSPAEKDSKQSDFIAHKLSRIITAYGDSRGK